MDGRAAAKSTTATPKRSTRKVLLGFGIAAVVLVGGLVLFAPAIAGAVAPSIIAEQAGKFVKGSVTAKRTSFSWGGPQVVGPLTWTDESGQQIAQTTISSSAGLLGLIRGSLDLGEVTISDTSLKILRMPDGTTNVQSLLKPGQAAQTPATRASTAPLQLPKGLKVRLAVKNVQATLVDQSTPATAATPTTPTTATTPTTITLSDVTGSVVLDPSQNLSAALNAKLTDGSSGTPGALTLAADIASWADSAGVVTLDRASGSLSLNVSNLPVGLVDALVGPVVKDETGTPVPLAKGLGNLAQLSLVASGSVNDAKAVIDIATPNARGGGEMRIAGGVLTTTKPLTASLLGAGLADLVPQLRAALASNAPTRVASLPDVSLTLDELRLKLPQGQSPLDLRGTSALVTLQTTQVQGQVTSAGSTQAMTIAPMRATLRTQDLSQSATLTAETSATLNNQPAGDVRVNASLAGLLDGAGQIVKGLPGSVNASVRVNRIATAVAQPFVQGLQLDLPRDLGQTLDLDLTAVTTDPASGPVGATPPLNLDFTLAAPLLRGKGALMLKENVLTARDGGIELEADAAGRLAQSLTAKGPWIVSPRSGSSGKATVKVGWLTLPLTAQRAPRLASADAQVVINVEGFTLQQAPGQNTAPLLVDVPRFSLACALRPIAAANAADLTLGAQGVLTVSGSQESGIGINMQIPAAILATDGATPWRLADPITLRPQGTLEIVNLPTALARAFVPRSVTTDGTPELDVAALLRDVVGPLVTIKATTNLAQDASGALAVEASVESRGAQLQTQASLQPATITLQGLRLQSTLTPQAFDAVLSELAPEMTDRPGLKAPATALLTLAPMTIPLDAQRSPKLAEAGLIKAQLTLPGRVVMTNLKTSATQRATAGLEDFTLDIEVPASSLIAPEQGGKAGSASATFKGSVLGMNSAALAQLSGQASAPLLAGKPQSASMQATLTQLITRGVDELLGKQGLVSGALGDSASLTARVQTTLASGDADAELSLTAPNVQTTGPLKVRARSDRVELVEPARISVQAQPAFVAALLTPPPAASQQAPAAPLALTEPTRIDIALTKLIVPKAAPGVKAPPPDVNVAVSMPQLALRTSDNKALQVANTTLTLQTQTGSAVSNNTNDAPLAFALTMERVQVQGSPEAGQVSLTGTLFNLVGAEGGFAMDAALVNARGQMPSVPTALLDVLAKKDGLLVEALGPVIELSLVTERYPLLGKPVPGVAPGLLDVQARSARATLSANGTIEDAVLVSAQPVKADLLEITTGLSGKFVKGLPLLGTFEKTRDDRAASITATNLRVPLSNDLSKLNGLVTIDPGQLRFGAGSEFAQLLNLAKIRTAGSLGTRLDPLTITVTDGVATYPTWRVPLGEFTMETAGTVDLVQRRVDVVTWVPLGALADEAAGLFNTGAGGKLGNLLGQASPILEATSMLPFRTKGPMDNPDTGPDLELYAQQFLKNLKPENLIEKGLGDLFKKPR